MNTTEYARAEVFGLSHMGVIRKENEDRFAIAAMRKAVSIMHANVEGAQQLEQRSASEALLMLVADGVGGNEGGAEASSQAATAVMTYLASVSGCYSKRDADAEHEFMEHLEAGLNKAHARVTEAGAARRRPPATTLTMALIIKSRAYIVHVGDSRAMYLRKGRLRVLTRDQTMAEELLDMGALTEEQAAKSSLTHQLVSAVGGSQMTPSLGLVDLQRDDMFLLCSDGLTKHVSNDRIAAVLGESAGVEQMCTTLLEEALAGGGSDNISIVLARMLA